MAISTIRDLTEQLIERRLPLPLHNPPALFDRYFRTLAMHIRSDIISSHDAILSGSKRFGFIFALSYSSKRIVSLFFSHRTKRDEGRISSPRGEEYRDIFFYKIFLGKTSIVWCSDMRVIYFTSGCRQIPRGSIRWQKDFQNPQQREYYPPQRHPERFWE